jgi:hypothetical protein
MRDSFKKKSKLDSTQGKFCCLFFAMLFINRMCCFFANKLGCIVVDLVFICLASFFLPCIYYTRSRILFT